MRKEKERERERERVGQEFSTVRYKTKTVGCTGFNQSRLTKIAIICAMFAIAACPETGDVAYAPNDNEQGRFAVSVTDNTQGSPIAQVSGKARDEEVVRLRAISENSHQYNNFPFKPLPNRPALSLPTLESSIGIQRKEKARVSNPSKNSPLFASSGVVPTIPQATKDRYAEFSIAQKAKAPGWANLSPEDRSLRRSQLKARIILGVETASTAGVTP